MRRQFDPFDRTEAGQPAPVATPTNLVRSRCTTTVISAVRVPAWQGCAWLVLAGA